MSRSPIAFIVWIWACAGASDSSAPLVTSEDSGNGARDPCAELKLDVMSPSASSVLSLEDLMADATPESPLDSQAFSMPSDADAPIDLFAGHLELLDESLGEMQTLSADSWIASGQRRSHLPEIALDFVPCGSALIPAQRGRIVTDDPYWDFFVSPGRSWSVPADGGMSRATVPFALTFKVENCIQNGLMTFAYDDERISQVRYQITQETCPWHVFDLWGQSDAEYTPGNVEDSERIQLDFLEELENRYPTLPLSRLEEDYPGFSLNGFNEGLTLNEQTARAVLVDGTLYLDECPTRYGPTPFCETMALPSYSLAKTLYVGLTLPAIAADFGVDPYGLMVSTYLPDQVEAAPGDWAGVTLGHLVDMSTGHYRYASQADDYMDNFFLDYTLSGRLESSFLFPYQEPPGRRTIYLTPNFQIAAAVMDAYLAEVGSQITDSFDYAVEHIYRPAGLPPDMFTTLRTWEDGGQNNGTAFGGYGMLLTPQGLARLGRFVLDGGPIEGTQEQVFDPDSLSATLFQDGSDTGAPMNYYDWSYNNGMWGYPLESWGCAGHVPTLFGVSGVTAMFAPNDVVYFTFNDLVEYPIVNILDQLDAIAPLCP